LPSNSSPNSEEVGPRVSRGILSGCAKMGNSECGVTDREPERLVADFDASRDVLILNIVYRAELVSDNCVVL
jgi:hypothetical protein